LVFTAAARRSRGQRRRPEVARRFSVERQPFDGVRDFGGGLVEARLARRRLAAILELLVVISRGAVRVLPLERDIETILVSAFALAAVSVAHAARLRAHHADGHLGD